MKILQLIHKLQNRGAETFACQLSGHLIAQSHEVKIVAIFSGEASLPFEGEIYCLNASPGSRFLDMEAWKKLAGIIKAFEPEIVQANAGDTLKYAVYSKLFFRWKASIMFRNASEVGRYLTSVFQKHYNGFLYRHVDRVASVSEASEQDLLRHFPFLKGKTEVLPIGLEQKKKFSPLELNPAFAKHIVHVGGFSFEKNHQGLLQIFQQVLKEDPQLRLHLVGDGPLREEIEVQVKKMELEEHVFFHGFVNNPLSYIAAADVLVLPSVIEGLPGVILEAMYCRVPVVAYDVGGISEVLDQRTGYLVVKNDEEAFAAAVIEVLENFDKARVENAHRIVNAKFMNRQVALKFVNSYKSLVPGS